MAAEVLTMCCFFVAAWVHPCCIGMTGVSSYDLLRAAAEVLSMRATKLSESLTNHALSNKARQNSKGFIRQSLIVYKICVSLPLLSKALPIILVT
jgi:hypothetical protein